jgi:hypothetical protein
MTLVCLTELHFIVQIILSEIPQLKYTRARPLCNPPVLTYVQPGIQRFDSRVLEYDVTLCRWECSCRRFEGV